MTLATFNCIWVAACFPLMVIANVIAWRNWREARDSLGASDRRMDTLRSEADTIVRDCEAIILKTRIEGAVFDAGYGVIGEKDFIYHEDEDGGRNFTVRREGWQLLVHLERDPSQSGWHLAASPVELCAMGGHENLRDDIGAALRRVKANG